MKSFPGTPGFSSISFLRRLGGVNHDAIIPFCSLTSGRSFSTEKNAEFISREGQKIVSSAVNRRLPLEGIVKYSVS